MADVYAIWKNKIVGKNTIALKRVEYSFDPSLKDKLLVKCFRINREEFDPAHAIMTRSFFQAMMFAISQGNL